MFNSKPHKFLSIAPKFLEKGKKKIPEGTKTEYKHSIWSDADFTKYCLNKTSWVPEQHDDFKTVMDIPVNDNGYYKDIYGQRISYEGIRTLKKPHTDIELSDIHLNEIEKCRTNFKYFRANYCLITTKNGLARPEPRPYQEKLENELLTLDDTVILYPRQSGKTVTSGTYLLWLGLFHEDAIMIGIVAQKPKTSREVLDKIKKIFLELPIWMKTGIEIWNKSEIEFENGTRIMTDGPSSDSFRGYTCNIIYVDETAYIKKNLWDEFVDSVMPTMNSLIFKQVIMTSTANGVNHFEAICKRAQASSSEERFVTTSWKNVPHYSKQGVLLKPAEYKKQVIAKFGKKYFAQTEECAFLGSSDTLILGDSLRDIENRVENITLIPNNILNDLSVYKLVEKNHNYIVSVDPSKDGIDDFSISVTDVTQFPFIQVADANLQIDYLVMPEHLDELGKYYNNALIIVENNEGSGQSITDTLWGVYEYENLYRDKNIDGKQGQKKYTGFRTTIKSRPIILNLLKIFINEGKLIVNSERTLQQLYTFTKRKTGNKYEAEEGYKDDAVMALAVMFAPFMSNKTFDNYELFVKELKTADSELSTTEFLSALDIGFSSGDDEEDYEKEEMREEMRKEMIASGLTGFSTFEDVRGH